MNVLLVSGRYAGPNDRHDADSAFARGLAAVGCGVRWVVPVPDRATARESDGIRVCAVESPAPRFAAVEGRLSDPVLERAVSKEIRLELPDVVHLLDYGGATSVNATWVAHRLGPLRG